jgi:hypothetical protein
MTELSLRANKVATPLPNLALHLVGRAKLAIETALHEHR